MRYWHGLGRGDHSGIGEIKTASMLGVPIREDADPDSANYVHVSPFKHIAAAFSALAGGNAICEIDPGPLAAENDPDFPSLSRRFRGPVNVVSTKVIAQEQMPHARRIAHTLSTDYLYIDGTARYTPDGYLHTPPPWREIGYTDTDYEWLGRWYPLDFLYGNSDGCISAITDDFEMFVMVPPGHPGLQGRPRIPTGNLQRSWTKPGFYPNRHQFRDLFTASVEWKPGMPNSVTRMPWEC